MICRKRPVNHLQWSVTNHSGVSTPFQRNHLTFYTTQDERMINFVTIRRPRAFGPFFPSVRQALYTKGPSFCIFNRAKKKALKCVRTSSHYFFDLYASKDAVFIIVFHIQVKNTYLIPKQNTLLYLQRALTLQWGHKGLEICPYVFLLPFRSLRIHKHRFFWQKIFLQTFLLTD